MAAFIFPNQTKFYQGRVRDVYTIDSRWLVMIASDRISAFDVILPKLIPYKGQVLNQIAAYMLKATKEICPNWLMSMPAPTASIGRKCIPFKIEMVVRGNLTGHAWRTYSSGKRELCGVIMPGGLKENDPFPTPIITPSTKAEEGHDEDISREEIIGRGLVTEDDWQVIENYALKLFEKGKEIAAAQGLILVDTKYEFGINEDTGELILIDELHTPDSSRYWDGTTYQERVRAGLEVAIPVRVLWRAALGCDDHPALAVCAVDQRRGPRLTRAAPVRGALAAADRPRRGERRRGHRRLRRRGAARPQRAGLRAGYRCGRGANAL